MLTHTLNEKVTEIRLEFWGFTGTGEIVSDDGTITGVFFFTFNQDFMFRLIFPDEHKDWLDQAIYHGGFDSKDEMSGTIDYYVSYSGGVIIHGSWSAKRLSSPSIW